MTLEERVRNALFHCSDNGAAALIRRTVLFVETVAAEQRERCAKLADKAMEMATISGQANGTVLYYIAALAAKIRVSQEPAEEPKRPAGSLLEVSKGSRLLDGFSTVGARLAMQYATKLHRFDVQFCYKGKEVTRARLACPIEEVHSVCAMIYTMIAPYRGNYALNFIDACDVPDEVPASPVVRISKEEAARLYDLLHKALPCAGRVGEPSFWDYPIVPGSPAMQPVNDCDMPDDQVQPHLTVE